MYGLPPGEAFDFFVGFTFSSFSVSRHQINLTFASPTTAGETAVISVEGSLGVRPARQGEEVFEVLPEASHQLAELLNLVVTDVVPNQSGTLALHFADGSSLQIHDSSTHYESYQISYKGNEFVV